MGRDPCRGARKRTPSSNYVREREGGLTLFIDTLHWELTTLHMLFRFICHIVTLQTKIRECSQSNIAQPLHVTIIQDGDARKI